MNGGAGEGFISEESPGIAIVLASISVFQPFINPHSVCHQLKLQTSNSKLQTKKNVDTHYLGFKPLHVETLARCTLKQTASLNVSPFISQSSSCHHRGF
jgi:hypothetical protein